MPKRTKYCRVYVGLYTANDGRRLAEVFHCPFFFVLLLAEERGYVCGICSRLPCAGALGFTQCRSGVLWLEGREETVAASTDVEAYIAVSRISLLARLLMRSPMSTCAHAPPWVTLGNFAACSMLHVEPAALGHICLSSALAGAHGCFVFLLGLYRVMLLAWL